MDKTNDNKSVSKSRRNLIKASAAAPVIASLHPGAAMAQTSVSACANQSHYTDKWVHEADGAMRHEGKLYVKKAGHGPDKLIELGETVGFGNKLLIDLDTHDHYEVNSFNNIHKRPASSNWAVVANLHDDYYEAKPIFVLIGFDAHDNHNKVGHWPLVEIDGHDVVALSQSCHTSIHPHGGW